MTIPVIAVIGAGNMGSSLISGLIKNDYPSSHLWAADTNQEKLSSLEQAFNIHVTTNNEQAVQAANVVIIAIKPHHFAATAKSLQPLISKHKPLIISVAAGIRVHQIEQWLGSEIAIVRTMPNTPALIGCGATALYANHFVTPEQHQLAERILRAVGMTVWLKEEKLLDTVTALSGSGPAYFFLLMEVLQDAAESLGLPAETARLLTLQTALGAARMAIESDATPEQLRHRVTSPGGTTEKAITVLEENNIRFIFQQALQAAKIRSEELANLL